MLYRACATVLLAGLVAAAAGALVAAGAPGAPWAGAAGGVVGAEAGAVVAAAAACVGAAGPAGFAGALVGTSPDVTGAPQAASIPTPTSPSPPRNTDARLIGSRSLSERDIVCLSFLPK